MSDLRKAIVLHSDILGFKSMLKKAESENSDDVLKKLKDALNQTIDQVNQFTGLSKGEMKVQINYKIFSDNIYVSFSYDENNNLSFGDALVLCVVFSRFYFANMLDHEFPVRGAISFGSDYSDETIIFSMALARAYELETKKAIYPRVIIDDKLVNRLKEGLNMTSELLRGILSNSILRDKFGVYFVNPGEVAKDFGISEAGLNPDQLSKGFLARQIKFVKRILAGLNPETQGDLVYKYECLLDILEWLIIDRKPLPSRNEFTPLFFQKA